MFAMDLARFQEITEVWSTVEFNLIRHTKGGEDRGHVLGPIDELNQNLEDNTLNLQSMSASQFIGPFLPTVQKWEKSMRTISNVLEAWVELQKRWMYLEGIFVGGDIRTQLPDEAKRFDDVDKAFRKIMAETEKNPNVLACCSIDGELICLINYSNSYNYEKKNIFII